MNNAKTIEIFSTASCHYCQLAKQYFKSLNLPYKEYDVNQDALRRQELIKLGAMGVPVIRIGGQVIMGFDRLQIDKLLGVSNSH